MYEIEQIKNKILNGDVLEQLRLIPDKSIDMCITSPPYWNMRDYNEENQIGLEYTIYEYIDKLHTIFNEVHRVLKDDGTCWINIRDSYSQGVKRCNGIKKKSMCMIPERLSIKMIDSGWLLRNTIIWHKPNAMPDSCKDRFTHDYEYVYMFSKSPKYKFNTQYEPFVTLNNKHDYSNDTESENTKQSKLLKTKMVRHGSDGSTLNNPSKWSNKGRIKRTTWNISTKPFKDAHFATFPEELILTPILAGSNENDIIMDIFMGSGTTGVVAKNNKRNYIGIELNKEYIEIANKRIDNI